MRNPFLYHHTHTLHRRHNLIISKQAKLFIRRLLHEHMINLIKVCSSGGMFLKIGNIEINGLAALAPMAGVADKSFRELCVKFGASYVISEMVSSRGISFLNEKTMHLLELSQLEHPCAVQIFGDDPKIMADSAKFALKYNPDIIDINMGCPAPKVNKSGGGAVLMKSPKLCGQIVEAVKKAINVPVTVKIRKGWDENNINAPLVAQICEDAGADAIIIHGRTREQMYRPSVDLDIIAQVKNIVKIPVIGNGDISSGQDALNMLNKTGCDMVMVGRAALGNPWIFSEINQFLASQKLCGPPSIEEKLKVMCTHVASICHNDGEKYGMLKARRHIIFYIKGIPGAAAFRNKACKLETTAQLKSLSEEILSTIYKKNL